MELLEEPRITRHLLTVDDYARMTETGVLAPDARVELIEGELIEMASMGTRHHAMISRWSSCCSRGVTLDLSGLL